MISFISSSLVSAGLLAADPSSLSPERAAAPAPPRTSAAALPEVVVTATREDQAAFDIPYTVHSIGPSRLQVKSPRTLPEALDEVPAVMLQKTAHGQGSPFIRGFTGFRTLMLIDGFRLNNATFREGPNQYWNTVDHLSVERLEVVKGPSSVLYGSDAIGGTVNAITRRRDEFGPGFDWDRRLFYRVSSAESSHIARGEISGHLDEQFGFLIGGGLKELGDLRGGEEVGRQPETGYAEQNWDAKLEYRLDANSRVTLAHQGVNQEDAWRTHSTVHGISWEGTRTGADRRRSLDQYRRLTYLRYDLENRPNFIEEFHAGLAYHVQNEQELRIRGNGRRQQQGVDVDTLGSFLQFHSPSPVGRWIYGAEYYRDWIDSFAVRHSAAGAFERAEIQGPVADAAHYDLFGLFVQDVVPLGERFEATLGGRYNFAAADAAKVADPITGAATSISDDWHSAVGSGRLLWKIDTENHWHAFVGASQGFRAPNLSDLTRFDIPASSTEIETPAPDLRPEHYVQYEAGLKVQYAKAGVEAAYYYTDIDEMIIRTPTGRTVVIQGATFDEVTKRNSGDGYIHGVDLAGSYRFLPQWTARAGFTWMEGYVEGYPTSAPVQQTEPVSRLMPETVDLSLLWESPAEKFWCEGLATIAARQDQLSAADQRDRERIPPGGTPSYVVFGIRAGWRPTSEFTLSLAVENLTDQDYRIHGSGLNEPGRNFIASIDYRF